MAARLQDEIKQTKPFASLEEEVYLSLRLTAQVIEEPWARFLKTRHQLSPSQYNLLRILRGAHPSGLTCSEIGERMINRDPDVTRLVDRLAKRKMVRRARDTKDRRVVFVFITPIGLSCLKALDEDVDQFPRKTLGPLGAGRLRELRGLLEAVRAEKGPFP